MNSNLPSVKPPSDDLDPNLKARLDFILTNVIDDERPYLTVTIFGVQFLGLLDSGASRTIIGQAGFERLKNLGLELLPANVSSCRVADGNQCEVVGSYSIPFNLQNTIKIIHTLVIPSLPHTLILGTDFWKSMGIVPDIRRGLWAFTKSPETVIAAITENQDLTPTQTLKLNQVVEDIFANIPEKLGCTTLVEHCIKTKSEPIKQRFYPISPALQKIVNKELDEMLQQEIVQPSSSPWSSPIVMVRKKDGSYRFCVDYRKVNQVTERDAYPLPLVTSTLDKLRDANYLTSLDIKSAYWNIPVEKESRKITAFTVPGRGLFEFCRMPFGLHNSPATWQRFIDNVLGYDLEPYVFVYLDDIIIVNNNFEKHLEIIQEVCKRLLNANLSLSKEKCQFCRSELKYLGYVVSRNGLHVDPEKVTAILAIPPPKTVSEVRRIIGVCSWYRRFIPGFSNLTDPITRLLRKNCKFGWTSDCADAFSKIKEHLVSAPILSCPNFDIPFIVQTDASDYGLGAVLSQTHEDADGERVVSYISRSLTKNERKFSTTEKECLAVVWAIEKFRPYIEATRFTVITDHFALQWLNTLKDPSGRLARWSVRLQQYDFNIIHRRGKDNIVPDALSRSVPVIDIVAANNPIFTDIKDDWYTRMCKNVKDKPLNFPMWRYDDHNLFKKCKNQYPGIDNPLYDWKIVVPKSHRKNVIIENHNNPTSGHCGVFKTYHRICNNYYWPKAKADVTSYIKSCRTCQANKAEQQAPAGLMTGRPNVRRPWELLCIDIVGPLPKSTSGHMFVFSVLDYFSKFCLFFPMRTATAKTICELLEDNVFLLFGVPRTIVCDNGKQFQSNEFKSLMANHQVTISHTAYYHPQANAVERVHRTLKEMLSAYVQDNQRSWKNMLQKVACAIRTSKSESTNLTPYFINFGREINLSGNHPKISRDVVEDDATQKNDNDPMIRPPIFEKIYQDVRKRLDKALERCQRTYNLRRRDVRYEIGQEVWHRNHVLSDASKYFSAKLAPRYTGPFVIYRKVSPWTYELRDPQGRHGGTWNVKDLKPYHVVSTNEP